MSSADALAPLDVLEHGRDVRDGLTIIDLSFASPRGGRVPAFLIIPDRPQPVPGLVFAHAGGLDRHSFLEEAGLFARGGAVCLLPDAPYARRPNPPVYRFTQDDRNEFLQAVAELKRGIDVLQAQPEVAASRIGFVGFSYGAIVGALLGSTETRIRSYILWSCVARLGDSLRRLGTLLPAAELDAYLGSMVLFDPIRHVGRAAPGALLLQAGRNDKSMPEEEVEAMYQAAGHPKQLLWYNTGHALNGKARQDRYDWMQQHLGIEQASPEVRKALGQFALKKMVRQGSG